MSILLQIENSSIHSIMAFNTSELEEYDNVELLMFEHTKHVAPLCDIDLTCYETFYDTPPSEDKNKIDKEVCGRPKFDLGGLEVFERDETNTGNCCLLYTSPSPRD